MDIRLRLIDVNSNIIIFLIVKIMNIYSLLNSVLPAILVFTMPFIFVIVITWLKSNEKHKNRQLQAEMYAKALESGQPVPADFFVEPKEPQKKHKPLDVGIICISVGVGIALTCWVISAIFAANLDVIGEGAKDGAVIFKVFSSISIIPFLIGVAFLIIHFIGKKRSVNENAQ